MKPWADEKHPSYHGPKSKWCLGCDAPCSKSAWGTWCYPCNVKRMTGINEQMVKLARNIGDEAMARRLEQD